MSWFRKHFPPRSALIYIFIFSLTFNTSLSGNQNKNKGVPTQEDLEFLNKIVEEIGFEGEIIISVGPYYKAKKINLSNGVTLLINNKDFKAPSFLFFDGNVGVYYILIDYLFYKNFTAEEKKFVIAHEVGHAQNPNLRVSILAEQKADEFALRYVSIETAIGFLEKYSEPDEEDIKKQRIGNLHRVKQG
ncbi:MAG: hypothetical protein Q7S43_01930 [bacterium]|nr:hypothetical protein [bacterium]